MVVKKKKQKPPPARDAGAIDPAAWPFRALASLSAAREAKFQVAIRKSVLEDIRSHGKSSPEAEVCGVLLGNVYRDGSGPWCYIQTSVRGNYAAGSQTQVTITSETWTHVNEVRDTQHPDKQFIGWYHTHPGFGIFLSGMDDFIHANWFGEPWQVALVYDPKSDEKGSFVWRNGKTANEPLLIVPDDEESAADAQPAQAPESGAPVPSGTFGDLIARVQVLEERQKWMLTGMAVLGLIALAWPLAVYALLPGSSVGSTRGSTSGTRSTNLNSAGPAPESPTATAPAIPPLVLSTEPASNAATNVPATVPASGPATGPGIAPATRSGG